MQKGRILLDSKKRLAEMYNIKIETASRNIKKLEKIGLIKCIYDHNDKNTRRIIQLVDNIWIKWSTKNQSNNQEEDDYIIKQNNKYNKKKEYKNNISAPSWLYEGIKPNIASPEEQAEIDKMIREITGDDGEKNE